MNIPFVVQTIHERRRGLDMIAKNYAQATRFAPRVSRYRESVGSDTFGVSGIER